MPRLPRVIEHRPALQPLAAARGRPLQSAAVVADRDAEQRLDLRLVRRARGHAGEPASA